MGDTEKHQFTRKIAFTALWTVIALSAFMVLSAVIKPSLVDVFSEMAGIITTVVLGLISLVAGYMGVTNYWGRR